MSYGISSMILVSDAALEARFKSTEIGKQSLFPHSQPSLMTCGPLSARLKNQENSPVDLITIYHNPQDLGVDARVIGSLESSHRWIAHGHHPAGLSRIGEIHGGIPHFLQCHISLLVGKKKGVYIYRKRSFRTLKNSNPKSKNHEVRHGDQWKTSICSWFKPFGGFLKWKKNIAIHFRLGCSILFHWGTPMTMESPQCNMVQLPPKKPPRRWLHRSSATHGSQTRHAVNVLAADGDMVNSFGIFHLREVLENHEHE